MPTDLERALDAAAEKLDQAVRDTSRPGSELEDPEVIRAFVELLRLEQQMADEGHQAE